MPYGSNGSKTAHRAKPPYSAAQIKTGAEVSVFAVVAITADITPMKRWRATETPFPVAL